jgi:hypothetical protein
MKIMIVDNDGTVIDAIDITEWDLDKSIAQSMLTCEIVDIWHDYMDSQSKAE